jgi:hypothetical protein
MWPDQVFHALVFSMPTLELRESSNAHLSTECAKQETLYPLYIPDLRASEANIENIRILAREYPNAKIIIAHLGRSYCL